MAARGESSARARRAAAAARYQPVAVRLLIVAEAPPSDPSRYFYFAEVSAHDHLFRYVARTVLGVEPSRMQKPAQLEALKEAGVFLIDLKPDPADGTPLAAYADGLVERARHLAPDHLILVKATVHDVALPALRDVGLPVIAERIPFPSSGQQKNFEKAMSRALDQIGWSLNR